MRRFFALLISVAALAGCKTNEEPAEPVVNIAETMMFLEPGLRPEVLLFPEYLMMEDFELQQHGRIPESKLIGAAMSSQLGLQQVRGRFGSLKIARYADRRLRASKMKQLLDKKLQSIRHLD